MFNRVLDAVEEAAADHIKEEPGDYYKDGLLYCGKCHTQKQIEVTLFGKTRKPYCLCKCAADELKREEREQRERERKAKIEERRKQAFSDPSLPRG